MSIQAVAWVLDHSRSRGFARLVLISLANHHNGGTGQCNPGNRLIAREAGVSLGSVPAQVRTLCEIGELEIKRPGTSHRSTEYELPFVREMNADYAQNTPAYVQPVSDSRQSTNTPGLNRSLPNHEPKGASQQKRSTGDPIEDRRRAQDLIFEENEEREREAQNVIPAPPPPGLRDLARGTRSAGPADHGEGPSERAATA